MYGFDCYIIKDKNNYRYLETSGYLLMQFSLASEKFIKKEMPNFKKRLFKAINKDAKKIFKEKKEDLKKLSGDCHFLVEPTELYILAKKNNWITIEKYLGLKE